MPNASVQHEQPTSGFSNYSLHDDIIFNHMGHIICGVHFNALCRLGMHDPFPVLRLDHIAVPDGRMEYRTPPMLAVITEHDIAIRRH
jgi:hypothetical protein